MTVTCYPSPGKKKGLMLCEAFAQGCGGQVAALGDPVLRDGAGFFYGWTDYTAPLIARCKAEGRTWFYCDNAYYLGRHTWFRVTKNAMMHDGSGQHGLERLKPFGVELKPWNLTGRNIVITSQSEVHYTARLGTTRDAWTAAVIAELRCHTDRPIKVCHKPDAKSSGNAYAAPGFEAELADAWVVVAHCSSAMVKALIDGVPVFSLASSMATRMGRSDLAQIEDPHYPNDRMQWLANLAANQWTRDEMRDGTCWRALQTQTMEIAA